MMLFESASEPLRVLIQENRQIHDMEMWQAILDEARVWKPAGYDDAQLQLRHYYEGCFAEHLAGVIAARYPNTGHRMPPAPYNWALLYAQNGAAVFDLPPMFFLKDKDGRVLPSRDVTDNAGKVTQSADAQAVDFATMVNEAGLQVTLAEADRRSTLVGDAFIRVNSDSLEAAATGSPAKTKPTLFWPNDVLVIPHPKAPDNLACALAIISRIASDDGLNTMTSTYEVWRRSIEETSDGLPVFGAWTCEHVAMHGRRITTGGVDRVEYDVESNYVWNPYPFKRAPWVVMRGGIASGKPFLDPNRNLVPIFDSVNGSVMSKLFAVDMGSASILVRKTDQQAARTIALGAGMLVNIPTKDDLISVPQNTDFAGINQSIRGALSMLAITARQRADGFDVEQTAQPSSGTALKIKSEPQSKARTESIARVLPCVLDLLSIMSEIHDHFRQTKILANGAKPGCQPQDPPEYEDLSVTQNRAFQLYDAGKITATRLLVMCRVADTEEDARAIIEAASEESSRVLSPKLSAIDDANALPDASTSHSTAPSPDVAASVAAAPDVQAAALNGAQVTALLEIVSQVIDGRIQQATAVEILVAAFPGVIDAPQATKIMSKVKVAKPGAVISTP